MRGLVTCLAALVAAALAAAAAAVEVFYVPHSHQDTGWLKTIDEYFLPYDDGEGHIVGGVKQVFDTLVPTLLADTARKFIVVEVLFFAMWWDQARPDQRDGIRTLVARDQLEFVLGGWSMNDEALTTHAGIVRNVALGHQWLWRELGVRPAYGWQVDPFGASSVMPALSTMLGFKAHLVSRRDYREVAAQQAGRALQFWWEGVNGLDPARQRIFTHAMDQYSYCTPYVSPGVYFDNPWAMPPVNDSNIAQIADFLAANMRERAAHFQTRQLLYPWGCDFQFHDAKVMFDNMDLVLAYMRKQPAYADLDIRYTTLREYFEAVASSAGNATFGERGQEDWFPYASRNDSYWTGFYASRSYLKQYGRRAEGALRAAEAVWAAALGALRDDEFDLEALEPLKPLLAEAQGHVAAFQHHDAITGTHEVNVTVMYEDDLTAAIEHAHRVTAAVLRQVAGDAAFAVLGASGVVAAPPAPRDVVLLAYNSLGWDRRVLLHVPVDGADWTVLDDTGRALACQVNPVLDEDATLEPPNARASHVLLVAVDVPALGYATFGLRTASASEPQRCVAATITPFPGRITLQNEFVELDVDPQSGRLQRVTDRATQIAIAVDQEYLEYESFSNQTAGKCSGWYVFRSAGDGPARALDQQQGAAPLALELVTGPLEVAVRQRFTPSHGQTLSLSLVGDESAAWARVRHTVGPLLWDRELVVRYTLPFAASTLSSDVNGKVLSRRPRRPDEPLLIPANYYPMTTAVQLCDGDGVRHLTALSDSAHGCASLRDNELEVMLHRRPSQDDNGGGKRSPLNDSSTYTAAFWLQVGGAAPLERAWRRAALALNTPPVLLQTTAPASFEAWARLRRARWAPLAAPLDESVHLLSVEPDALADQRASPSRRAVLLRLEHLTAQEAAVRVPLALFARCQGVAEELLLSGLPMDAASARAAEVDLNPLDIRTLTLAFDS